jgi:hypothetical protein
VEASAGQVSRANGKNPGGRVGSKKSSADDSRQSGKFPSVTGEKSDAPLTVAVTDFLAELRLSSSERVLGALALALAEGMDASPPYAKGKLARELREVLSVLAQAEISPANLALLQGVEL